MGLFVPSALGQGSSSSASFPGGRVYANSWADNAGHLWLFGGYGLDSSGAVGNLNDLWAFDPASGKWTSMSGSTDNGASPANVPGGRNSASVWADKSGNLWLFGGEGLDANGVEGNLNDLWELNAGTQQWTRISGDSSLGGDIGRPGSYGVEGVPASANLPSGRQQASGWIDSNGNLWLFGGRGFASDKSKGGFLNDLWTFSPSTSQWTWVGGSSSVNARGAYGSKGVPSTGNCPGSRSEAVEWTDSGGNFWLFGGRGFDATGVLGDLNDLWEFNPSTEEWTWIAGSSSVGNTGVAPGIYGTTGVPSPQNTPGGRSAANSWIDSSGNLWLFGGSGYLSDLWVYNPFLNEWTWMGNSGAAAASVTAPSAVRPASQPSPTGSAIGGRYGASTWTDASGNLILFGGIGFGANGNIGYLSDMWNLQPNSSPSLSAPDFSIAAGSYDSAQVVTISGGAADTTIYYTLDGSPPTVYSSKFTSPITVRSSETIEAIAESSDTTFSPIATATYLIDQSTKASPTVTITADSSTVSTAQPLSLTVQIAGVPGNATPTGSVVLVSGSYVVSAPLLGGTAAISLPAGTLPTGNDTLSVSYQPDAQSAAVYTNASSTLSVTVTNPSYSITATAVQIAQGAAGVSTVTVASSNGYTGTVALTCNVAAGPTTSGGTPTCSVAQPVVLASSASSGATTVTVNAPPQQSSAARQGRSGSVAAYLGAANWHVFLSMLFLYRGKRRGIRRLWPLTVLALIVALSSLSACGGGPTSATQSTSSGGAATTYIVTLNGVGNDTYQTAATASFSVTVQ